MAENSTLSSSSSSDDELPSDSENNQNDHHDEEPLVAGDGSTLTKRLIIQKMVMTNFKSYAGEREIGPFHKVRFILFFNGF